MLDVLLKKEMKTYLVIPVIFGISLFAASCGEKAGEEAASPSEEATEVAMEPDSRVVITHPGDVPPISIFAENDQFMIVQHTGTKEEPIDVFGNRVVIELKTKKTATFTIKRNSSNQELAENYKESGGMGNSAYYIDQDGDGVVDFRRGKGGLWRASKIEWEHVGGYEAKPTEDLIRRVDIDIGGDKTAEQEEADRPFTRD